MSFRSRALAAFRLRVLLIDRDAQGGLPARRVAREQIPGQLVGLIGGPGRRAYGGAVKSRVMSRQTASELARDSLGSGRAWLLRRQGRGEGVWFAITPSPGGAGSSR
ncbi:hypothetical protein ACIBQ1_59685 [Nonomuraea sp. NPDC050153]|uniref:hypothetical protein n=1 Tax=Nonomuraea sp. NPDC050153 TaxID=3364359 RepID=UPI0037946E25